VIVTLENIFAFFIKHSQNFDWGTLKQNYSDIPLLIYHENMLKFIESSFKIDYVFFQIL